MIGLTAGYVASVFALAGWAWFERFFQVIGVNTDAIVKTQGKVRLLLLAWSFSS
jgi:hypothetical protein